MNIWGVTPVNEVNIMLCPTVTASPAAVDIHFLRSHVTPHE